MNTFVFPIFSVNCIRGKSPPTRDHILQEDADVLVPVRAGLLMVEAQRVEQLMLDDLVVDTTLATQRHNLAAVLPSNV